MLCRSAYSRSASAGPVAAALAGLVVLLLLLAAGVIVSLRRLPARRLLKTARQQPPERPEQPSPDLLPAGQYTRQVSTHTQTCASSTLHTRPIEKRSFAFWRCTRFSPYLVHLMPIGTILGKIDQYLDLPHRL